MRDVLGARSKTGLETFRRGRTAPVGRICPYTSHTSRLVGCANQSVGPMCQVCWVSVQVHHNICRVVAAVGSLAPNTLVLPLADGGAGRLRNPALTEDGCALGRILPYPGQKLQLRSLQKSDDALPYLHFSF